MAHKRSLEESDAADATPVKRGRGRPRKNPEDLKTPRADPSAPKRGRGRPRKNPDAPAVTKISSGRGRGRPRKNPDAPPAVKGPGRGRSRKSETAAVVSGTPTKPSPAVKGRGRGRPRKSEGAADDSNTRAKSAGNVKSPSKSDMKLSGIVGTYQIEGEEVDASQDEEDGEVEDMIVSISTLEHSDSALIASFHLGIVEGTMLLAADRSTLERVCAELERGVSGKSKSKSTSKGPIIKNRTVYFLWRGRDTDEEGQIHPGTYGDQEGTLEFDDNYTAFTGKGRFPMGPNIFKGGLVDKEPHGEPEPWNTYDEEAYEEANKRRWR